MSPMSLRFLRPPHHYFSALSVLSVLVGAAGCDIGEQAPSTTASHTALFDRLYSAPLGEPLTEESSGCVTLWKEDEGSEVGEAGSGGDTGSDESYGSTLYVRDEHFVLEYYLPTGDGTWDPGSPDSGELVARLEGDAEFLASGEVQRARFVSAGGMQYEAIVIGGKDCGQATPDFPPPSDPLPANESETDGATG